MVVQVAEHDIKHGTAAQREEHHEFEDGKAAALLLGGRLWVAFLVFVGVRQLSGGGIDYFNRTAIELAAGADPAVGGLGGSAEGFFQSLSWQTLPGLHVAGVPLVNETSTVEAEQSLDMADDLAAGGFGSEHLPEEALEGEAQAKDPVAAVGALIGG